MKFDRHGFLKEKIVEIKKEIKERKKWKRDIQYELGLVRTYKYNRQDELRKMWKVASVMIEEYEKILANYEEMLERVQEIDK